MHFSFTIIFITREMFTINRPGRQRFFCEIAVALPCYCRILTLCSRETRGRRNEICGLAWLPRVGNTHTHTQQFMWQPFTSRVHTSRYDRDHGIVFY